MTEHTASQYTLELRFAKLVVYPEFGTVETWFADKWHTIGSRSVTFDTLGDAKALGYTKDRKGIWRSLIDHEALHSLLSDWIWERQSRVMRHEAGAEQSPYHERIFEEAIVLAFQLYKQTGSTHEVLQRFNRAQLWDWRWRADKFIAQLGEAY